jgi:hypothetical protein
MILPKNEIFNALWKDGKKVLGGWWKDCLFDVYEAVDTHQKNNGIRGNLAEIGIFEGRSLVPLVNLKEPSETVVAVDINDASKVRQFISALFPDAENINVIRANSTKMNVFAGKGPFRMFYIDGDHSHDGCFADLVCASKEVDDGIIFLDDYDNPTYGSSVRSAVDQFIRKNKQWSLVAITGQTLWISKNEHVDTYTRVFESLCWNTQVDPFYPKLTSFQDPKGLYHH